MPPKKRPNAETKDDEKFVYVLVKSSCRKDVAADPKAVGVYVSKAAAVAASGAIAAACPVNGGKDVTFDTVIESGEVEEDYIIDHRKDPPDDGCLLKVGDEHYCVGDFSKLFIQKMLLQDKVPVKDKDEVPTGLKKKAK